MPVYEPEPEQVYIPEPESVYIPEPEPEPEFAESETEFTDIIGELGKAVEEINNAFAMPYAEEPEGEYTVNIERESAEDDEEDFDEFGESEIPSADEFAEITQEPVSVREPEPDPKSELDQDEDIVIGGIEFKDDNPFSGGPIGVDGRMGIPPIFEKQQEEDIDFSQFGYIGEIAEIPDQAEESVPDAESFGFAVADSGQYGDKQPSSFTLFGKRIEVRDWQEMLVKLCEVLILKSPYMVASFDKYQNLNSNGQICFSYNESDIRFMGRRLSNGLWIEINRTPDDTVALCRKLLELCGYSKSELAIEIRG